MVGHRIQKELYDGSYSGPYMGSMSFGSTINVDTSSTGMS